MALMLIPAPLGKLVGMAKAMPSVLKTVASMAKVESDGTPAIITSAVNAASAKDVDKIQQQQKASLNESNVRLTALRSAIANDNTLSDVKRTKKLGRVDEMLDDNSKVDPNEVSPETRAALVDANKKKLEPTILASLAPFTAIIGIPIFLTQLMKYLGPSGLSVDASLTQGFSAEEEAAAATAAADATTSTTTSGTTTTTTTTTIISDDDGPTADDRGGGSANGDGDGGGGSIDEFVFE